jgi:hypothetical protein
MGEVAPSRQQPRSALPMRRKSRLIAACVMLSIVVAVAAFVLHRRDQAPRIVGDWKSWRSNIQIAQDGDGYRMVITNPNGFLGGNYSGTPHRDVITVSGPLSALCGRMLYVRDDDALDFCGEEFKRVKP